MSSLREYSPGDRLDGLGVLVTSAPGDGPVRGVDVVVAGDALARGVLEVSRVRARPWSARLAPWELTQWEGALTPGAPPAVHHTATLPGVRCDPPPEHSHPLARTRLAHAVWVSLDGLAAREGDALLTLTVTPSGAPLARVSATLGVRVRTAPVLARLVFRVQFPTVPRECARLLHATLRALCTSLARAPVHPPAPCTFVARALDPARLHTFVSHVHAAPGALRGDARWAVVWQRFVHGRLDALDLVRPASDGTACATITLAQASRFVRAGTPTGTLVVAAVDLAPDVLAPTLARLERLAHKLTASGLAATVVTQAPAGALPPPVHVPHAMQAAVSLPRD